MLVVVRQRARHHRLRLLSAEDQRPVKHLTTNGVDPPLRERVRLRGPHRCAAPDALGAEDRIEAVGEPPILMADEEPELAHDNLRSAGLEPG
jgi:hypothetical protein